MAIKTLDALVECPKRCPGCSHRNLNVEQSLFQKSGFLSRVLKPWDSVLKPIRSIGEDQRFGYRERTCLRAKWNGAQWEFGFLDPETRRNRVSEQEIISIPECPVHSQRVRSIFQFLSHFLPHSDLFVLHYGVVSGKILTLVLKQAKGETALENLDWGKLNPFGIDTVYFNFHPSAGNRVFSNKGWKLIYGQPLSRTEDGLVHGPQSFQQVLPELYNQALDMAENFLAPANNDWVIDLYCGLGASIQRWQSRGARSIGIELSQESILCASKNLNPNQLTLFQGRCSDRIPQMMRCLREVSSSSNIFVFANPPRIGLEASILNWIVEDLRPSKLAYLSCSAGTLARDLERFESNLFKIESIVPLDFFPHTHHVETLTFLSRSDRSVDLC